MAGREVTGLVDKRERWVLVIRGIIVYDLLMGAFNQDRAGLCSVVSSEGTRSDGHELKYKKFHLNVREGGTLSGETVELLPLQIEEPAVGWTVTCRPGAWG